MVEAAGHARPIDLHTHSTVSDGTEAPAQLIAAAIAAGIGIRRHHRPRFHGWVV